MFHEHHQKKGESVDEYAQDLKHLYQRAYAWAQHENPAAEAIGRSILAYQFMSGLLPELKAEVAGTEGDSEHQLAKARFEVAKACEFGKVSSTNQDKSYPPGSSTKIPRLSRDHTGMLNAITVDAMDTLPATAVPPHDSRKERKLRANLPNGQHRWQLLYL